MRKVIALLMFFVPMILSAQSLAVSQFYLDEKDLTANNEATKVIDDNNEVCALIRIETTQKGFTFDGGTIGIVKADESKVGEIWLYVPAGLNHITIRHPQLGTLRDYYFPEKLKPARTYVMKLITGNVQTVVQQKSSSQWLVLTVEPKGAMVEIDGMIVEGADGQIMQKLSRGNHDVRVSAKDYHTEVLRIELGEQKVERTVKLNPAFGWIEIEGPNGASVFIDNQKIGEAPIKSNPLASGTHDLRVTKDKWLPYREQVLVSDNTVTTVMPQLTANFATVTLQTEGDAEIWVDDVKMGNGKVTIELSPKEYTFETRKAGHRSQSIVREISMATQGAISIPAPVAMQGILSVEIKPVGAKIYVDDKYVGESPLMLENILVGKHRVKSVAAGLTDEERTIEIREGETSEVIVEMSKILEPTRYPGVVVKNGVLIKVPKDFKGDFVIGVGVTSIGEYAFSQCSGLSSVTIPNSVTSIGEYAFSCCYGLTSITIPNSVKSIGYLAFNECTGLSSVTIPNSVSSIGEAAFYGCIGLTSIKIPDSVIRIGDNTFYGCIGLTSIKIPNSVKIIGNGAFWECEGLTSVTIPNSVTNIGGSAFLGCINLKTIYVPKGYKKKFKKMLAPYLKKLIVEQD